MKYLNWLLRDILLVRYVRN